MQCPYCNTRLANSSDHVFPSFFGGRATVSVCKQCNDTFGHTFEGVASKCFKAWLFMFRRCGLPPPKPTVWKRIAFDELGNRYDINQDLVATLSDPEITRGESGKIERIKSDERRGKRILKDMVRKGKQARVIEVEKLTIDMRALRFRLPLDDDMKRLCLKMSVACGARFGYGKLVGERPRRYLFNAQVSDVCPVRIAVNNYLDLDERRPPLGHLIYVRASNTEKCAYSIVQFFGAVQFYCELNEAWDDRELAFLATHDPVSHIESFEETLLLDYQLPPRHLDRDFYNERVKERFEKLRQELVMLYGDQAPQSFCPNL